MTTLDKEKEIKPTSGPEEIELMSVQEDKKTRQPSPPTTTNDFIPPLMPAEDSDDDEENTPFSAGVTSPLAARPTSDHKPATDRPLASDLQFEEDAQGAARLATVKIELDDHQETLLTDSKTGSPSITTSEQGQSYLNEVFASLGEKINALNLKGGALNADPNLHEPEATTPSHKPESKSKHKAHLTADTRAPQYGRSSAGMDSWITMFSLLCKRDATVASPPQAKLSGLKMAMLKSVPQGGTGNLAAQDLDPITSSIILAKTDGEILRNTIKGIFAVSFTIPQQQLDDTDGNYWQKGVLAVAGLVQCVAAYNAVALRVLTGLDKDFYYLGIGLIQRAFRTSAFESFGHFQHEQIEKLFEGTCGGNPKMALFLGVTMVVANLISTSPLKQSFESDALLAQQFVGETLAKVIELFAGRDLKKKAFEAFFAAARSIPQLSAMLGYTIPVLGPFIGATNSAGRYGSGLAKVFYSDTAAQVLDAIKNMKAVIVAGTLLAVAPSSVTGAVLAAALGKLWYDYFNNGTHAYEKHLISAFVELFENYGVGKGRSPINALNQVLEHDRIEQESVEHPKSHSSVTNESDEKYSGGKELKPINFTTLANEVQKLRNYPVADFDKFFKDIHAQLNSNSNQFTTAEKKLLTTIDSRVNLDGLSKLTETQRESIIEANLRSCNTYITKKDAVKTNLSRILKDIGSNADFSNPTQLQEKCAEHCSDLDKALNDFKEYYHTEKNGYPEAIQAKIDHITLIKAYLNDQEMPVEQRLARAAAVAAQKPDDQAKAGQPDSQIVDIKQIGSPSAGGSSSSPSTEHNASFAPPAPIGVPSNRDSVSHVSLKHDGGFALAPISEDQVVEVKSSGTNHGKTSDSINFEGQDLSQALRNDGNTPPPLEPFVFLEVEDTKRARSSTQPIAGDVQEKVRLFEQDKAAVQVLTQSKSGFFGTKADPAKSKEQIKVIGKEEEAESLIQQALSATPSLSVHSPV